MSDRTPEEQTIHVASAIAQDLVKTNEAKAAELVAFAATSASELKKLLDVHKIESQASLVSALREVMTAGDEGNKLVLINRIPFICKDILDIKAILKYILLGIGALFLTLVGSLLLAHVGVTKP